MGHHTPLTFRLSRVAHGQRNLIETNEEASLQIEARQKGEVLLPGVDIATAWAMLPKPRPKPNAPILVRAVRLSRGAEVPDPISMRQLCEQLDAAESLQVAADTGIAESGFAVFMSQHWTELHHVVRYFDLIEKNEAPDTPLLEWLVTAGVVKSAAARATVKRFTKRTTTLGRHKFVLLPADAERLTMAAGVRAQLEYEEKAAAAS